VTRAEHLAWCKQRALEYVDAGDPTQALASLTSDLRKHKETKGHSAIELGMMLAMSGHLDTQAKMREWIEGVN
jgi:hypothetical protein